jgi:hypothetical protein
MRRIALAFLMLISTFTVACAGGDSQDDCAFRAQDGTCAVVVSEAGDLECKLDDAALCHTMTAYLDTGEAALAGSSAAQINFVGGMSLVCEPDGTFMCTCCSVKAGCYPCPKKATGSLVLSDDVTFKPRLSSEFQLAKEASETKAP